MKANYCYDDASHQSRNSCIVSYKKIPVTSLDIAIPSLSIFGFMLLYYLFCDVCSDMLTCVFCIMFELFSNDKNDKNTID